MSSHHVCIVIAMNFPPWLTSTGFLLEFCRGIGRWWWAARDQRALCFVLVRCTYGDDNRWASFLSALKRQTPMNDRLAQFQPWTTIEDKNSVMIATVSKTCAMSWPTQRTVPGSSSPRTVSKKLISFSWGPRSLAWGIQWTSERTIRVLSIPCGDCYGYPSRRCSNGIWCIQDVKADIRKQSFEECVFRNGWGADWATEDLRVCGRMATGGIYIPTYLWL